MLAKKLQEMISNATEFYWYCGGTMRFANGNAFNWVPFERAGNGAISWTFYESP